MGQDKLSRYDPQTAQWNPPTLHCAGITYFAGKCNTQIAFIASKFIQVNYEIEIDLQLDNLL